MTTRLSTGRVLALVGAALAIVAFMLGLAARCRGVPPPSDNVPTAMLQADDIHDSCGQPPC